LRFDFLPMNYLRYRSEQLANFLREGILRGEYPAPFPSTRIWCQQLGVGRPTLLRALQALHSEGLISMTKRGAVLSPLRQNLETISHQTPKIVRILTQGSSGGYFDLEIIRLSEQLQLHGIRLVIESCNLVRLKKVASQPGHSSELYCLLSIPVGYQKHFLPRKDSTLVLGFTNSELSLPYLTPDLNGCTRHATNSLLRQGFKRLIMLENSVKTAGAAQCVETFKNACKDWHSQQVQFEVHLIWTDLTSMRSSIKRIVSKIKEPCGILIHAPISLGILVTNLLQKHFDIPKQVAIRAIEYRVEEVQFSVPIPHYAVSTDRFTKEILHVALHFFETGVLPDVRKVLPMDVTTHG